MSSIIMSESKGKTVRLQESTWTELASRGHYGDSADDIVKSLLRSARKDAVNV